MRRKLLLILMLLMLSASTTAAYVYYYRRQPPPRYQTAHVARGRVAATVNSTGTVNAVVTVQVGSQVSGNIQKLFVDYNSPVTEDQVIAQIDPAPFEIRVTQARATLASAQAAVQAYGNFKRYFAMMKNSSSSLKNTTLAKGKFSVLVALILLGALLRFEHITQPFIEKFS
jgi:HlyD family secretion protein